MPAMKRGKRALLASLTLILTAVPLTVVTSLPAEAAYGRVRLGQLALRRWRRYRRIHEGAGPHGQRNALLHGQPAGRQVRDHALQDAIQTCYSGSTPAAQYIVESGGIDGVYGEGTVRAVRWVQANRLGFTGSDVDGTYGPATRSALKWPTYSQISGSYTFKYTCKNPNEI